MNDGILVCKFCGFAVYGWTHMNNHIEDTHADEANIDKDDAIDEVENALDDE